MHQLNVKKAHVHSQKKSTCSCQLYYCTTHALEINTTQLTLANSLNIDSNIANN
jgi:hypothetical protein